MPIGKCDPIDLEVHPAGDTPGRNVTEQLPQYVPRAHDERLAEVVAQATAGQSTMAVLVGSSSTGKTRACWEAVQPLAKLGWRLWHPFDPTRADAALAGLNAVGPRTVVWLNEAQHYLDAGEQLAAALHALLTDPARGPVLVLGTLWPEYELEYTRRPQPGAPDRYARVRELLAGRRLTIPDGFDAAALQMAAKLAENGDRLLAGVLERAHGGHIAQHLAGAPELLRRYENASPPAKGLLLAAMDARRLGVGLHLPLSFLTAAAPGYLHSDEFDVLAEDWPEHALTGLTAPVHGNLAPLRPVRERPPHNPPGAMPATAAEEAGQLYRLADYLEQHGRQERWDSCPPASFWHAAHTHLAESGDLRRLGDAARGRHRLRWADALYRRAADAGDTEALTRLAWIREESWGQEDAEALIHRSGGTEHAAILTRLAAMRREWRPKNWEKDEASAQLEVDAGSSKALTRLATIRASLGDRKEAETLYRRAADAGDTGALTRLALMRELAGDRQGTQALTRRAADAGDIEALTRLALMREEAGDQQEAETLAQRAADAGNTYALTRLALTRERLAGHKAAEALFQRAADSRNAATPTKLAAVRQSTIDPEAAKTPTKHASETENTATSARFAALRQKIANWNEIEPLYLRVVDAGDLGALSRVALILERDGNRHEAEALAQYAADAGNPGALIELAVTRQHAGDRQGAEKLYRRAADTGSTDALLILAELRREAGDREQAEALAQRAADAGNPNALVALARALSRDGTSNTASILRYGIDPDDTPSQPW